MKQLSVKNITVFLIGIILISAFTLKPAKTDFSGKWKLNESKSELGQFANFAPRLIETLQTDSGISISRTAKSFDGEDVTTKEVLTFDGKLAESAMFGQSKKKSSFSWSEGEKVMTITYTLLLEFNGQSSEVKGKEVWTLGDDGNTITVKNNSSSSFGELDTKSVYEKQ